MGSTPVIQTSFNAGEWAPALNARVDVQKYHSGAALLRNFFVDYRGGATTRPGTRFVCPALSNGVVRLIPFQASIAVGYVLEFGDGYMRPIANGAPILNPSVVVSGITQANPGVVTAVGHGYSNGQQVFISGVGGMSQINGGFYFVKNVTANTFTLTDPSGAAIDTTSYGAFASNGTVASVYQIASPYTQFEVFGIKYTQDVNILIMCHGNHPPYQLVLGASPTSWTLSAIVFGSTATVPTGVSLAASGISTGAVTYAYLVTSVDQNGQESGPSAYGVLSGYQDMRSVLGTITVSWAAAAGAQSYNVYKALPTYSGGIPSGSQFGFIGNCFGTSFIDSNIQPDFSQGPPVLQNPFAGGSAGTSSVANIALTWSGSQYNGVPTVYIGSPTTGVTAAAIATLATNTISMVANPYAPGTIAGGAGYAVGNILTGPYGIQLQVTSVYGPGVIGAFSVINSGTISGAG